MPDTRPETDDDTDDDTDGGETDINLKIIDAVREHKNLYDLSNPDYRNKEKRSLSWRNVCMAVWGLEDKAVTPKTIDKMQAKWKSLRSSFVRTKREKTRSGQATSQKKTYKYARAMAFLKHYIKGDKTIGTPNAEEEEDEEIAGSSRGRLLSIIFRMH